MASEFVGDFGRKNNNARLADERKLKGVRQEVRNLQVLQMRPNQPPEKLALLRDLEMSARAEVKLRLKALEHGRWIKSAEGSAEAARGNRYGGMTYGIFRTNR